MAIKIDFQKNYQKNGINYSGTFPVYSSDAICETISVEDIQDELKRKLELIDEGEIVFIASTPLPTSTPRPTSTPTPTPTRTNLPTPTPTRTPIPTPTPTPTPTNTPTPTPQPITKSVCSYNTWIDYGTFPAGTYTIKYVSGAWSPWNNGDRYYWGNVNISSGTLNYGFGDSILYSASGAVAAGQGKKLTFAHNGGNIRIKITDTPISDNRMNGCPTYSLWYGTIF